MRATLVLAVLALLSACNGGDKPETLPTGTGSPTTTSPPTTSTPTATPPKNSLPTGKSTTIPPTTKPSPSATATAGGASGTLDLACARRGVDTQGITIKTEPTGPAGFNSLYSDGSNSVDGKSDYKTGFNAGFADGAGIYRATWVPPPNAPTGPVIVRVITQFGTFDLVYKLVAATGTCP